MKKLDEEWNFEMVKDNKVICISGFELCTEKVTGIERYMREMIWSIDSLLDDYKYNFDIELCYPKGNKINISNLKNIKMIEIPMKENEKWNTGAFRKYVKGKDALFLGMANNFTLYHKSVVVVHDIRPIVCKDYDTLRTRLSTILGIRCTSVFAKKIITVSEHQKCVIKNRFKLDDNRIDVTYNGYDHMKKIEEDDSIFNKNPRIIKGNYYYALGSVAKHKNFKWIYEMAKRNPECQFVVGGNISKDLWKIDIDEYQVSNLLFVGYVSDEQNKSLLANCKAYLQPSFYEGFGIPPLEAISLGVPIAVSNIPVFKEIFSNAATYFDCYDYDFDLSSIRNVDTGVNETLLEKFTWKKSAEKMLNILSEI